MTQPDSASLVVLRAAVDDLEAATGASFDTGEDATGASFGAREHAGASFDAGEHATRYEAVHDALVAVLADVDGG